MKKVVLAVPLLALALGGTTACATKKFVRGEVGQVNNKVDTLSKSLEETQERTRQNVLGLSPVAGQVRSGSSDPMRRDPRRTARGRTRGQSGTAATWALIRAVPGAGPPQATKSRVSAARNAAMSD